MARTAPRSVSVGTTLVSGEGVKRLRFAAFAASFHFPLLELPTAQGYLIGRARSGVGSVGNPLGPRPHRTYHGTALSGAVSHPNHQSTVSGFARAVKEEQ